MFGVIETMNHIQQALAGAKMKFAIELPRIAVIGSQSSGKSSVLESIVGEEILPRGVGIVTRCPLILQLQQNKENDEKTASFSHLPGEVFTDFAQVTREIIRQTDELAGSSKKIVDEPIFLTVTSPSVPNLTLIDLPGFTKLSTDDQSATICEDIENMVMRHIKEENTIILAISPANGDIANSDGLAYAKKVDPKGDRTFGVMTKIDIMDKGTDACDFLSGKIYKLKHGYIGVKCRSQQDNNDNKTITQSVEEEKKFFENHPAYCKFADTQGTEMLAKKLSDLLEKHIIKQLPKIEDLIQQNYEEYNKILKGIGKEATCTTECGALEYATRIIDEYKQAYIDFILNAGESTADSSYSGGSQIYQIFK
jgi:replication fork clamp-binding protein CrfC